MLFREGINQILTVAQLTSNFRTFDETPKDQHPAANRLTHTVF